MDTMLGLAHEAAASGGLMDTLYLEDFVAGTTTTFGRFAVTEADLIAYARRFDPQPFHVDPEAAKAGFAGRLIASGWHTIAMEMRMICDAWLLRSAGMGSPGIDEVKWLKPVVPGDVLHVRQTILGTKVSRRRPDMGVVQFHLETLNQDGAVVMSQKNPIMFQRRDRDAGSAGAPRTEPDDVPHGEAEAARQPPSRGGGAPDVRGGDPASKIGVTRSLGQHCFAADEIVDFARAFDPQPFHVDAQAAARSHFGGLVASGWHTAAIWMSLLVAERQRTVEEARADGRPVPRYGTSPGFTNLRWLKPVRVGDTINYATTLVDTRPSATRPGWGLILSHNTGHNQLGEMVFEFNGSGFVGMGEPR